MTMFRMTNGKNCFYIDLRIGCYIITYFSLASYIALAMWIVIITLTIPETISLEDPGAMQKLTKILALGMFLFPVTITMIKYNIILLIGVRKKSRFVINLYLVFVRNALVAFITACIAIQFYYPMDTNANIAAISIPIHASLLCVVRSYWKQLEPKNAKMQQQIV